MIANKLNKTILVSLMLVGASFSTYAGHDGHDDRARVISVTPQVERINIPVQECRTEYVSERYYEDTRRSNGGAIVGTIAGGLVGSRFGGGNGRLVTTAIGAGLGAVMGDRHDNRYSQPREHVQTRPVDRCVSVDRWETVNRGYLVDYEYNGRRYTTETLDHPGRYIPVNVSVRPGGYISHVEYRHHKKQHNNRNDFRHRY